MKVMKIAFLVVCVAVLALCGSGVRAADTFDGTIGGTTILAAEGSGNYVMMKKTVKFEDYATTAGDTIQIFDVPADVIVLGIGVETTTVEGATLTIDVGDGTDPDGFIDGYNANSASAMASSFTRTLTTDTTTSTAAQALAISPAYGLGKYYSATDTIDVLVNNTGADTAVLVFKLIAIQL
jgi:hypothetical protein